MQSALSVYEHRSDTTPSVAPTFNCPLYIKQDEGIREAPSALILACARELIASRFRPGAPFRPWLLQIVANEARTRRRRGREERRSRVIWDRSALSARSSGGGSVAARFQVRGASVAGQ